VIVVTLAVAAAHLAAFSRRMWDQMVVGLDRFVFVLGSRARSSCGNSSLELGSWS